MNVKWNADRGRYLSLFATGVGCGAVVAGGEGLIELFLPFAGMGDSEMTAFVASLYPMAKLENGVTGEAALLLRRYFAGERVSFALPVDKSGFTTFQSAVYRAVALIPYGRVKSYAEIAYEVGRPHSARGVGGAMARNPLPIIIPCHRVVGRGGALTGYSGPGGVMSKKWLLNLEGVELVAQNGKIRESS